MHSSAKTVRQYLSGLPKDRRAAIEAVRKTVLKNLPKGYEEAMNWGFITHQVPLRVYPDTYNKQPLMFAALANQKRHMAVYLTTVYADDSQEDWFRERYLATGKRLDMGKSCVRFRKLDDLPVELIGEVIGRTTLDEFLSYYDSARG